MKWIDRRLCNAEASIVWLCKGAMFFIILMCLFITADVVASFVFNKPIPGASEISEYFLPLVVFLPLGWTLLAGGHPRVNTVLTHLPRKVVIVLDVISSLLIIGFMGILTMEVAKVAYEDWVNKVYHPYAFISLPQWIPNLLSSIAFILLIIASITQLVRQVTGGARGEVIGMKTWKEAGGSG